MKHLKKSWFAIVLFSLTIVIFLCSFGCSTNDTSIINLQDSVAINNNMVIELETGIGKLWENYSDRVVYDKEHDLFIKNVRHIF